MIVQTPDGLRVGHLHPDHLEQLFINRGHYNIQLFRPSDSQSSWLTSDKPDDLEANRAASCVSMYVVLYLDRRFGMPKRIVIDGAEEHLFALYRQGILYC